MRLLDVLKPSFRFLPHKFDSNTRHQASIWSNKTYKVDPKTHVFTTIQEHFGNRLIKKIKLQPGSVAVDIGCFIGEKLWQLKDNPNYLGVGVDIAVPALRAAQQIDIYGHKFIAANMENLPFKDHSVDLVMVFDVIEHLTHAQKGFAEVARILKPGGQFLLHIPILDNKWSMFWWKQKLFPQAAQADYDNVGHAKERMLSSSQIKNSLEKHGLKLVREIYYNSFFVHFWDREFLPLVAKITQADKSGGKSPSVLSPARTFYGKYMVPLLEIISAPDWVLSRCKIGNTYFCLSTKR